MSKQHLDIQQMQHLKELGIDISKASSKVYKISETEEYCGYSRDITIIDGYIDSYIDKNDFFTLQDILDLLPSCLKEEYGDIYYFMMEQLSNNEEKDWNIRYCLSDYSLSKVQFASSDIIDSAYEMLCWCIMNGYIKTKKKE